jgi:hypothetical protein
LPSNSAVVWAFYAFALVFGLRHGGESVCFSISNRQELSVAAPLGTIYPFQTLGAGNGIALGGSLGGFHVDLSDAYTWSIAAAILNTCLGIPLALALPRRDKLPAAGGKAVIPSASVIYMARLPFAPGSRYQCDSCVRNGLLPGDGRK